MEPVKYLENKAFLEKNRKTRVRSFQGATFLRGSKGVAPQGDPRGATPLKNLKWDPLFFIAYSYSLPRKLSKTL